jgi:hypothetical protein
MKLSELIAATPVGTDPELRVMLPWGEIETAILLDQSHLIPDDPAWEEIAAQPPGSFILTTATTYAL